MPVDLAALIGDLRAESSALVDLVERLRDDDWDRPTPAEGWLVRDQISHLAFFDDATVTALQDPDRFRAERAAAIVDVDGFTHRIAQQARTLTPDELLAWFTGARAALIGALAAADPATRMPWYGPDMGVASAVTARIMETWAHGQDVADALGVVREPGVALRHVAHLGVATRGHSYRARGLEVPATTVRVELAAPDGTTWTWGDVGAHDLVRGRALDFCLVVVQRRHVDDTALEARGPTAREWLTVAQAFAGPPGRGRAPAAS